MISVCIPTYNFDASVLIGEIEKQANNIPYEVEVIVIDDCSKTEFRSINFSACKKARFIPLPQNVGRAKIRNLFLQYANHNHLLFIDCDSELVSENFLLNYIEAIEPAYPLICGGTVYKTIPPERSFILRWKYGVKKESISLQKRLDSPSNSFMSNNFLVSKALLNKIRFDERLREYGHEDTLFGYQVKMNGINVKHINNPVIHNDLEENSIFLRKTEIGIKNLLLVFDLVEHQPEFIRFVTLLDFYTKMKAKHISNIIYFIFKIFQPALKFVFTKGYLTVWLFDFYKLGILSENLRNNSKKYRETL